MSKIEKLTEFVKSIYGNDRFIPLHEPYFNGNEKKYLNECIDSTYVSSVGKFVDDFEESIAKYANAKYAIATMNGTAALHTALMLAGVGNDDEVITQSVSFIATCNAIKYCNAEPVFIDIDKKTLGLSASALIDFLENGIYQDLNGFSYNLITKKRIKACVPMHTFGHPCEIDKIVDICKKYKILVIEDAAEALGSFYKNQHCGTFGDIGVLSFNGNKTLTAGGGGIILTDNKEFAQLAKHLTTTAKVPHKWDFNHDMIGYNYRMPNINAALACAQLEQIDFVLKSKRETAIKYKKFCKENDLFFVDEPSNAKSNFWLNAIVLKNKVEREEYLKLTNSNNVMTRPLWDLMSNLKMFENCYKDDLSNSIWVRERIVNIPSSVNLNS